MSREELGMIEVRGFVAAVGAADAAVKAAEVKILGYEPTKGSGLVVLKFSGEVSAVEAALRVASETASRITFVHAAQVIPKVYSGVANLL